MSEGTSRQRENGERERGEDNAGQGVLGGGPRALASLSWPQGDSL